MDTSQAQQKLQKEINKYVPRDDAERLDKERMLNFLTLSSNVYSRDNLTGHITVSCRITNRTKSKALLIHHNQFDCRAPLGGHADNETNLSAVACKEAREESGLQHVLLLCPEIIDISVMTVPTHQKKDKTIPKHFHFDVRYLLQAEESEPLSHAQNEVSDAQRFSIEEIQTLDIDIMPIIQRVIQKIHPKKE